MALDLLARVTSPQVHHPPHHSIPSGGEGGFLKGNLMSFSSIRRATQPDFEPLSLSEVKSHLRIMQDMKDDDQYLMGLIAAARIYFENRVGQTTTLVQWKTTSEWPIAYFVGKEDRSDW